MPDVETYRSMVLAAVQDLETCVGSIPEDVFGKRPAENANPASFIYFHVLRHWDRDINIGCRGQRPDNDAWHWGEFSELTGYNPDGKGYNGIGTGYGYSKAEADEVPADKDTFLRYHAMLRDETDALFDSLDMSELDADRTRHDGVTVTPSGRFQHLFAHTYLHIGDIEYVKGLVGAPAADLPTVGS